MNSYELRRMFDIEYSLTTRVEEERSTTRPNQAGTAWSHNFLNQKPWHPLSYHNWIAEQTHAQRAQEVAREANGYTVYYTKNEIIDPYGHGREYLMQEERGVETKIIRTILSGNADSLKPNSGQSVAIRDVHSICVGCGEEDGDGYIVWEWHGHIMAYDEQFGYSPEYIFGSYFQRVKPRQEAAPLPDEEEEEIERGSQGLRDLIDATKNDSVAAAHILHRNVNASNSLSEENKLGVIKQNEAKLSTICLKKSATFPIPNVTGGAFKEADLSITESSSGHSALQKYSRSKSLPAPLNLKSAMKGSREKNGEAQCQLTVKWAADVYDPVPTLMSHTVKHKKQQKSRNKIEKKNKRKGHKKNSTRGDNVKDNKQFHNHYGHSDLYHKPLDSPVIEASSELDALGAQSQDSYCGTSFLKKSVIEVHYSVAEAQ